MLREKERLAGKPTPVDPESVRFQNWNHAPFAYPNPEGSRFYGPEQNVLELADDLQTALVIAVARRETFLSRTAEPAPAPEIRQLIRRSEERRVGKEGVGPCRSRGSP